MSRERRRLAIVASHVIQYQDPLFRRIAAEPDIDLTVFYCSRRGAVPFRDADMGTEVDWDLEMLSGYRYQFLRNVSPAGEDSGFGRFINPGLAPALARGRFDAVIFMIGWGSVTAILGMLACRAAGVPFFLFGDSSFPPPETSLRAKLRAAALRALFAIAAGFMVSGAANAAYYRHYGADPRRFFLLPFAVDNERFAEAARLQPGERDSLRRRYGIAPEAVAIAFSGKLVERKDPRTLLEAFARMPHRDDAALVFIGDGPLRASLEQRVREESLRGVSFTGFVNQSELPKHYAMCDLFALPSTFEPRGLVANEAAACGLPLVVSDRCGCIGDVAEPGENAFVHPAGDSAALADILETLVTDGALRERMGARSRTIISGWSFERGVAGVQAMLRSVRP